MKITTENILTVLKILAWIAFIGLCIKSGAQIIGFITGFFNAEYAQSLYGIKPDYFGFLKEGYWVYVCVFSTIIAISLLKTHVWFLLVDLLSKLNLQNPFTKEVAKKLEKIAYELILIWVASFLLNGFFEGGEKYGINNVSKIDDAKEFLFVAGIVYIISQIFKRGIEIQEENELTV